MPQYKQFLKPFKMSLGNLNNLNKKQHWQSGPSTQSSEGIFHLVKLSFARAKVHVYFYSPWGLWQVGVELTAAERCRIFKWHCCSEAGVTWDYYLSPEQGSEWARGDNGWVDEVLGTDQWSAAGYRRELWHTSGVCNNICTQSNHRRLSACLCSLITHEPLVYSVDTKMTVNPLVCVKIQQAIRSIRSIHAARLPPKRRKTNCQYAK